MEPKRDGPTEEDLAKMVGVLPKMSESVQQTTALFFLGVAGLLHCCEKGSEKYFKTKFMAEELQIKLRKFITDLDEILRNG